MAATGTTVAMPMSGDKEEPGKRLSVWERWPEQAAWRDRAPGVDKVRTRVEQEVEAVVALVDQSAGVVGFDQFEDELREAVFRLARLLTVLFLAPWHERLSVPKKHRVGRARYRRQPAKGRWLGGFFGKVRYWRYYLHKTSRPVKRRSPPPVSGSSAWRAPGRKRRRSVRIPSGWHEVQEASWSAVCGVWALVRC